MRLNNRTKNRSHNFWVLNYSLLAPFTTPAWLESLLQVDFLLTKNVSEIIAIWVTDVAMNQHHKDQTAPYKNLFLRTSFESTKIIFKIVTHPLYKEIWQIHASDKQLKWSAR